MDNVADPRVIAHVPQDHRHVTPQELKNLPGYNVIMNKPNTTIMDYAMDKPEHFLKSTSRWTELHILAFRCLFLNNLPISRILPQADLPDDNDPTMKLIIKHLSDSEDDIDLAKVPSPLAQPLSSLRSCKLSYEGRAPLHLLYQFLAPFVLPRCQPSSRPFLSLRQAQIPLTCRLLISRDSPFLHPMSLCIQETVWTSRTIPSDQAGAWTSRI
jgi:hypothetical protein